MLLISAYGRVLIDCHVFLFGPAVECDLYCLFLLDQRLWELPFQETDHFMSICITFICKLLRFIPPPQHRPVGGPKNRIICIGEMSEGVGMWATGTYMDGGGDGRPNRGMNPQQWDNKERNRVRARGRQSHQKNGRY